MIKKFQISAQYLWGWSCNLDTDFFQNKDEIVVEVLKQFNKFLIKYNLLDLKDLLDMKRHQFHIHDTEEESFPWPNSETVYICNHN